MTTQGEKIMNMHCEDMTHAYYYILNDMHGLYLTDAGEFHNIAKVRFSNVSLKSEVGELEHLLAMGLSGYGAYAIAPEPTPRDGRERSFIVTCENTDAHLHLIYCMDELWVGDRAITVQPYGFSNVRIERRLNEDMTHQGRAVAAFNEEHHPGTANDPNSLRYMRRRDPVTKRELIQRIVRLGTDSPPKAPNWRVGPAPTNADVIEEFRPVKIPNPKISYRDPTTARHF